MNKKTNKNRNKMANEAVTKKGFTEAKYAKHFIEPVIDALQKINVQAVGGDQEAYQKITSFTQWLNSFVVQADEIIAQGNRQYEERPQKLISTVVARMLAIPEIIFGEQRGSENKIAGHGAKIEELKKKSFSDSEIANILPYPQDELDTHTSTIAGLQVELKSIEIFLADAPRYDVSLLSGVDIESLLVRYNQK